MGKKYKNLYEQIVNIENLQFAFEKAAKGKKSSSGFLNFNEFAQVKLLQIEKKLKDETWTSCPLRIFTIYEPKQRIIGAPSFADRIVHHAICNVIEPIFDKTFLPYSFACRYNKGTHVGIKYLQSQLRKHNYKYYLKTDFKAYFPSINRKILYTEIERKISCKKTIALLEQIIPRTGYGVPIGALTSQLAANIYGNKLDHFIHHKLKLTFARYMDDVVILSNDIQELRKAKKLIEKYALDEMEMRISKWNISTTSKGINFLGYRIWKSHKLMRKSSVIRAKRKIRYFIKNEQLENLEKFIGSWLGHAKFADSKNLRIWLDKQNNVTANLKLAIKQRKKQRKSLLNNLLN